ncbi:TMEM165/GDT1 family protein [Dethiothermospora halolimnae]|uniref:TMEM165/GDT1 family protein n=1 Tax=Dethiothermospora halolimnae TaxID=3114390 RepID=UPI003CCB99D9
MISEIVKAFMFIFVAEMGDKTQILAMTFATKYSVTKVLTGVLIGSFLNHGLAIMLGAYLSNEMPVDKVQVIAGIMFIFFGLWALKSDDDDDIDEDNKSKFGPVITVALAFFIGELGDKTQLTAMTLATDGKYPFFILVGTVTGMIGTSSLGIFVGRKVGEKIPELAIKLVSSGVFLFFGTLKLIDSLPAKYITPMNVAIFFILLIGIVYILLKPLLQTKRDNRQTALKEVAATLYLQANKMKEVMDDICLGEGACGSCEGGNCLIGYTKNILNYAKNNEEYIIPKDIDIKPPVTGKNFDKKKVIDALGMTVDHLLYYGTYQSENYVVNRVRQALEKILLGEEISFKEDGDKYFKLLKQYDKEVAKGVKNKVKELKKERKG